MPPHEEVAHEQGERAMAQRVTDILFPEPRHLRDNHYVTSDAIDNLEGVLETLKARGGNSCVSTLEAILIQLGRVRDLCKEAS